MRQIEAPVPVSLPSGKRFGAGFASARAAVLLKRLDRRKGSAYCG